MLPIGFSHLSCFLPISLARFVLRRICCSFTLLVGLPFGRFLSVLSQIMWPVSRRQAQCMHMHNMGGDGCLTDAYGAQQESKQAKNTEHSKEQQHIAKHSKQSTANKAQSAKQGKQSNASKSTACTACTAQQAKRSKSSTASKT